MSDTHDGRPIPDPGTTSTMGGTGGTGGPGDEALRLDGNAAAGLLAEVFVEEMTSAQSTCAQCGRTGSLGSLLLYGGQMGTILRCPGCDHAQLRIVRAPAQGGLYWMDMRGMTLLRCCMAALSPGAPV